MCPNCRAFITTSDRVCPYCDVKVGPRAIERRNPGEILGGLIPHARFTTVLILVINFALFAATYLYSQNMGLGFNQALHSLDGLVQSQAIMLATNHMFLLLGAVVALTAIGVWLMPRPETN